MKKLLIFLLIILQLLVSCNSDEPINTNESISTVNYLKEGFWCYSDTVFNKSGYLEKISSGYKFTFVKNILVLDINLDGNLSCSLSSGERFILGRDVNINGWSDAFILPGNQHNNSAFMSIKDSYVNVLINQFGNEKIFKNGIFAGDSIFFLGDYETESYILKYSEELQLFVANINEAGFKYIPEENKLYTYDNFSGERIFFQRREFDDNTKEKFGLE